ncbi:sugar phosphate isomerase/epimerase, partial [bacterium]|nr:sugar phosphate isomerase/epimerase [bacterium]
NNLFMPAIGTGQAFGEEGLSLTHKDETIREKAFQRMSDQIVCAKKMGGHVIIGLLRGIPPKSDVNIAVDLFRDSLKPIAKKAEEAGVNIVIEPINRYETSLLHTVDETVAFINTVQSDSVGILFDTFHANIEEVSIEASIERCGDRLFHVHLADSNRWAPGQGHIDFPSIIATLKKIGYNGFLSAEILPKPTPEEAAKYTIGYMNKLLRT